MKECLYQTNRGIRIFVLCCFSSVMFWIIIPIVSNDRTLSLPCWYPVDYKNPFVFQIAYFLQIMAQLQISASFVASTSSRSVQLQLQSEECSGHNLHMGASKEELIKLRDIKRIPDKEINEFFVAKELPFALDCLVHILSQADTMKSRSFREAFDYALEPCVRQHLFILNALRKLQRLYNIVWFVKMFEVILAICVSTFDVIKSSGDKSFLQVFALSQYMFLALWEIFMIFYADEKSTL